MAGWRLQAGGRRGTQSYASWLQFALQDEEVMTDSALSPGETWSWHRHWQLLFRNNFRLLAFVAQCRVESQLWISYLGCRDVVMSEANI